LTRSQAGRRIARAHPYGGAKAEIAQRNAREFVVLELCATIGPEIDGAIGIWDTWVATRGSTVFQLANTFAVRRTVVTAAPPWGP
jgi:hypothetical protein